MEPIISSSPGSHSTVFGNHFGIPFSIDSIMYGQLLTWEELLLCYSIPPSPLPYRISWSRLETIVDALLPGALVFVFIDSIASSESRLGKIYDNCLVKDDDEFHGAHCYFQEKVPSTHLDWEAGYENDAACTAIIATLKSACGKIIPDEIISSMHMGFRQPLWKQYCIC